MGELPQQKLLRGADCVKAIRTGIAADVERLRAGGVMPCVGIVRVGNNADDISYENSVIKKCELAGIECRTYAFEAGICNADFLSAFADINADEGVHGMLLFRPLPKQLDENAVIDLMDPHKDLDGMTMASRADVYIGDERGFAPCTAEAVIRLLEHEHIPIEGQQVVVIGRSLVVGKPLSMMLLKRNATITVCHTRTRDMDSVIGRADILVCAAGHKDLFSPDAIKQGAVVVDVGIHVDENGNLSGDVDTESVGKKASRITPVPGGVGNVTSWLLIEHAVRAAENQTKR